MIQLSKCTVYSTVHDQQPSDNKFFLCLSYQLMHISSLMSNNKYINCYHVQYIINKTQIYILLLVVSNELSSEASHTSNRV